MGEVSQSAGGRRGSDFLLKEQSDKLIMPVICVGCYNAMVAMVAMANLTKKPTRAFILCPRLLLTMGGGVLSNLHLQSGGAELGNACVCGFVYITLAYS